MKQSTVDRWSNPEVILVNTDFLESPSLMFHAIHQAKLSGAKIILVHVARPSFLQSSLDPRNASLLRGVEKIAVRPTMDQMFELVEGAGIPCELVVLRGTPVEQISLIVKSRGVDRVIVAARSLRGVERLLMGSVAEELAATLEVPICMVGHGTYPCLTGRLTPPRRILVANSFHDGSSLCTGFAAALAEVHGAHLTLLHVLDSERIDQAKRDEAQAVAHMRLATSIPMSFGQAVPPQIEIREGDAATQILEAANSSPYDFIILGSSPHSVVSRILASRVIHRVVSEAKCPVMTIKPVDLVEREVMFDPLDEEPTGFLKEFSTQIALSGH